MKLSGKTHKYGDNVDTDVIIPARYLNTSLHEELAAHCMEDIDAEFISRVRKGDIIVAGSNFGCGSSREHAPIAIKAAGISCVIAKSFARIFFRNAINIGLPILECDVDALTDDEITVDLDNGEISVGDNIYNVPPYPESIQKIIRAGGLMNSIKEGLQ